MIERSLKKRVSFIGIGQLFNALINILLLPYLARSLEVDVYGTYGQVLLICGVFQAIFAFGFSKLIFNYLNQRSDETKDNLVTNTFVSCFILAIVGVLILFLGNNYIASLMKNASLAYLLRIYALSILFNLFSGILTSVLNHFHKVKSITVVAIVNNLFRIGVIIIFIQLSFSLETIFWGLLGVSILQFLLLWVLSPTFLLKGKIQGKTIRKIILKGLPLSLSGITTILLVQTDGIMVSSLIDTESYAIYRMGAIPIPFLFIIYSSVIMVTMADVTKYFHQGAYEKILSLKRKASFNIAILTYPTLIFILVFAKEILGLYLGEKYHGSLWVFVIYNFLLFLRITDYRDILIAAEKTKVILIADVSIFIFNVILNYILILKLSAIGAVISSIISYYLLAIILQSQAAKTVNARPSDFFEIGRLLKIFFISAVFAFLFYLFFRFLGAAYYFIPIMSIVYILVDYFVLIKLKIVSIQQLIDYSSHHKVLTPLNFVLRKV